LKGAARVRPCLGSPEGGADGGVARAGGGRGSTCSAREGLGGVGRVRFGVRVPCGLAERWWGVGVRVDWVLLCG